MPEEDPDIKANEDDAPAPEDSDEEDIFPATIIPPTNRITLQIDYEEGEPWGITFGKNLTILSVKKDMRADGVLYPGDVIISINDIIVEDQDQFYNLIKRLFPLVRVEIERKVWRTPMTDLRAKQIALIVKKRHDYFIAYIHRIDGIKLGLSVKQTQGVVLVTKCKEESLVSHCYQVGDHILDVDGCRVYTTAQAKLKIVHGLKSVGCVSTVVERKRTDEEETGSNRAMLFVSDRCPKMAPDAVRIGQLEAAKVRANMGKQFPLKSILRTSSSKHPSTLHFEMTPTIMRVVCDTREPHRLIHVRRKDSSRGFISALLGRRSGSRRS